MHARVRWLLAAAVLVPGLVIGALAAALLSPGLAGPSAAAVEVTLWLGIAAVLAVSFGAGMALLRLWLTGPIERLARHLEPAPVAPDGDPLARIAQALDWFQRQAERDRALLTGQLDAAEALRDDAAGARARLEEADRLALVGRVAMGVAHELGGPLALLAGWLERLQATADSGTPAERARCIAHASEAAAQIERLLNDLARPGLVGTREDDRPSDVAAVVRALHAQLAMHPRLRQITLQVVLEADPAPADVSASHLSQVLLNLVLNAADAMRRQGAIQLRVAVLGSAQAQVVVVDVEDNGPGIAADLRARIFEPNYTSHATPGAIGDGGWGLGLAISRRTLARYGATLEADDSPLGGARFRVSLPLHGSQPTPGQPPA